MLLIWIHLWRQVLTLRQTPTLPLGLQPLSHSSHPKMDPFSYSGRFPTPSEGQGRAQTCRGSSVSLQDTPRVTPVHFNRGHEPAFESQQSSAWAAPAAIPLPSAMANIPGREELRSERDDSWLTALVSKLSASFLFYGCDLQGGSCPLAAAPCNSWPRFLVFTTAADWHFWSGLSISLLFCS